MLAGLTIRDLDRKLTFESYTGAVDVIGNKPGFTWGSPFTVWGNIKTSKSPESFEGSQQMGLQSIEVIIRYRSGINDRMRFTDLKLNDLYYVRGVEDNPREGYTRIIGEKRDNQ